MWWNRRRSCWPSTPAAADAPRARNSQPGEPARPVAGSLKARIACLVPIFGEQDARHPAARNARTPEPERKSVHTRPISRQAGAVDSAPDSCDSSGVRDRRGDFLPGDCSRRFESAHPQDSVAPCPVRRPDLSFLTRHRPGGLFTVACACKDCSRRCDSRPYAQPTSITRSIRRSDQKGPPHPCRAAAQRNGTRCKDTR